MSTCGRMVFIRPCAAGMIDCAYWSSSASTNKAKAGLKEIWMAETQVQAETAFDSFQRNFEAKYPNAVGVLVKDRELLLAFYDFPAEHWLHIRTTNPIDSSFATIRHRTTRTKSCVSRTTLMGLVFQLALTAEKSWRKIQGI